MDQDAGSDDNHGAALTTTDPYTTGPFGPGHGWRISPASHRRARVCEEPGAGGNGTVVPTGQPMAARGTASALPPDPRALPDPSAPPATGLTARPHRGTARASPW